MSRESLRNALRTMLDAWPRCQIDGCSEPATHHSLSNPGAGVCWESVNGVICDRHARDLRKAAWYLANEADAIERGGAK